MAGSRSPGWPVLLVLLVLGGIIGGWIGQALTKVWPSLAALGSTQSLGIPNFTADLGVFTISFGFMPVSYTHLDVYKRQVLVLLL